MSDYLDTRDLYEEMTTLSARAGSGDEDDALDEGEAQRLADLADLFDQIGEDAGRYGETMIPESEFEDYAQELAEDIGAIKPDLGWPYSCIDWERAARELAMDYTSVTFDGEDYLIRL